MVDVDFEQYNESNHPIFSNNLSGIPSFLCKLNAKFKNRQFCDVRLYPGLENKTDENVDKYSTKDDDYNNKTSSNPDSVYAHKLILDIASPYFSQVFHLCDKSQSNEGDKLEAIIIPNMDYSTLEFLVRFIYTGDTTFINAENIEKIINGASTFMLQSLKNRCCDIITSYETVHTCLDKWRLASQKMDGQSSYFTALCTTMTEFVFQNQQVFHLQSFLTLEVKEIFLLVTIATHKTSCTPDSIIEGVIHWVKGKQEDRQEFLYPLLKLINLKEVPVSVLRNIFRENPIVSSDNDCQEYYIEFLEGMALERQNQHLIGQNNHTSLKIDENNNNNSNSENTPVILLQKDEKDETQTKDTKLFQTNPQDHPVILLTEAKKPQNGSGIIKKSFKKVNTSFLLNDLKTTPTAEFLNLQLTTKAGGEGHFINGTNYQSNSIENSEDLLAHNNELGKNGNVGDVVNPKSNSNPGDGTIKLMNSGDDNIVKIVCEKGEAEMKESIEDTEEQLQNNNTNEQYDIKENMSEKSLKMKKAASRSSSKKKRKGELLMAQDHNMNMSNPNTHTIIRRRSKTLNKKSLTPVLPVSLNSADNNCDSNTSNITTSSNSSNSSSNNISDPSFVSKLVHNNNKQQEKLEKEDLLIKTYSNTSLFILHQHAQNNNNNNTQSLSSSSCRPKTATKFQYGTKIRQPYNMDKNNIKVINHSTSSKGFSIRSKSVKRISSLKLQGNQLRKSTPRPSSPCLGNWREKIDKQQSNDHDHLQLNMKMNDKEEEEEDEQEAIIISNHSQNNNNNNNLESIVHSTSSTSSSSSCNNSIISNPVSKTELYNSTSFNDKDANHNNSNYCWNNMKDNSNMVKTPFPYQSQCQWYKEQVHISKLLGQRHNIHDPATFLTSRSRYPSTNFEEPRLKRLKMIVKKGRPGKFSSKINLSRINHNNSKLSLPNYPTLRNSTTNEKTNDSHGRNSSANSNNNNNNNTSILNNFKTKRFQNKKFKNRLMFYVEDSPNEERYLMSYDLQTRTRSKLASYTFTGNGNCMIFHEGSLYDMGGCFKDQANNRLEIFDFDQNYGKKPKWRSRKVPKMILPRYGFQTTIHDNTIYVIGGLGLGAMNWAEKLALQESNQKNWKWTNIQMLNRSRAFSGVAVFNDKIYALGGFSIDSDERACKVTATNSVEYYCSKTDEWEFAPGLQTERAGLCAVTLHNKLYVIGGGLNRVADSKLKSVEYFDPELQEWKFCASMKKARQYFSVAVFDDHILAVGGDDDKCPTMERYDPIENEWKIIDYIPVAGNYSSVGFKDIENDDLQNPFQIQIPPSPLNH